MEKKRKATKALRKENKKQKKELALHQIQNLKDKLNALAIKKDQEKEDAITRAKSKIEDTLEQKRLEWKYEKNQEMEITIARVKKEGEIAIAKAVTSAKKEGRIAIWPAWMEE